MKCREKRYRARGRIVVRRIGEDLLLVPVTGPASGRVYPLNASALAAWEGLADGGTVRRAAQALWERFDGVGREQALSDARDCVRAFLRESLIEERPP